MINTLCGFLSEIIDAIETDNKSVKVVYDLVQRMFLMSEEFDTSMVFLVREMTTNLMVKN